jgi:hypothetical protein
MTFFRGTWAGWGGGSFRKGVREALKVIFSEGHKYNAI